MAVCLILRYSIEMTVWYGIVMTVWYGIVMVVWHGIVMGCIVDVWCSSGCQRQISSLGDKIK